MISGLAQDQGRYEVDLKDPKSVVRAIFYAAESEDFDVLRGLCDPLNENDSDTRNMCELHRLQSKLEEKGTHPKAKKRVKSFKKIFAPGRIRDEISYSEFEGAQYAEVPVWIDHPSGKDRKKETVKLVKRYGNWYLSSL